MPTRPLLRSWLWMLLSAGAAALPAQQPEQPAPDAAETPAEEPEIIEEAEHDRARSWSLFASCDADSDDRLSLFEARYSLVDLDLVKHPESFRALDADRDGFLQWPEFDAHYRSAILRIGKLRLRPARRVQPSTDPARSITAVTPSQQLIRMLDEDGDDRLNKEEFAEFLKQSDVNPALTQAFPKVDANQSGSIDHRELNVPLGAIPGAWQMLPEENPVGNSLPLEFRTADRNFNGVIDRKELELALRRIHPSLSRWTDRILKDADSSGNGTLGGPEIQASRS